MSFRNAISHTIAFGQVLGLMPIHRNTNHSQNTKWKAVKCCYSFVIALGSFLLLLTFSFKVISQKNSLGTYINFIVYLSNCITIVWFFNLGKRWHKLMTAWDDVEKSYLLPGDINYLSRQLNLRLMVCATMSISKQIKVALEKLEIA